MLPVRKNGTYEAEITDLNAEGEGIGRVEGFTVFVPGALPGERIRLLCLKVAKSYAIGKLQAVLRPSPDRVEPPCPYAPRCGGCAFMCLSYPAQLRRKRQMVADALARIGGLREVRVEPVLGMADPFRYRNKAQYPAGPEGLGFYARRSHRVIPVANCLIQHPLNDRVLAAVGEWMHAYRVPAYDETTGMGLLRHGMARVSFSRGEVLAVLVSAAPLPHRRELVALLRERVPGLVGVVENRNDRRTNAILGRDNEVLWGKGTLTEELMGLTFQLSPHSFFQVNPRQTEVLYGQALAYAGLTGGELVADAYCGTGTIALLMARQAGQVIGLESVPQAVADARENARRNGIANARFVEGPAEATLPELVAQGIRPDVVVTDPPRKGCGEPLLNALLACAPRRIVYVSCNPATLARDLARLAPRYRVEAVQPVDMFPFTGHVETVCLLSKLQAK